MPPSLFWFCVSDVSSLQKSILRYWVPKGSWVLFFLPFGRKHFSTLLKNISPLPRQFSPAGGRWFETTGTLEAIRYPGRLICLAGALETVLIHRMLYMERAFWISFLEDRRICQDLFFSSPLAPNPQPRQCLLTEKCSPYCRLSHHFLSF